MFVCHNGHIRENVKDRCKICKSNNSRKWRENNKDKILDIARIYYTKPEKIHSRKLRNRELRAKFPERYLEIGRRYYGTPSARNRTAKRRALKKLAIPKWANLKEIQEFYRVAKEMEGITGQKYHVDHIIPLQGKTVCGLHVEYNLQVIPAKENQCKSNRLQ